MPLTKTGHEVMADMKDRYGEEGGERVFYATGNKRPELKRKWEGKRRAMRHKARDIQEAKGR